MATELTVVVPAYSGIETIARTLKSIAGRDLGSNIEVLIVQDGPRPQIESSIKDSLSRLDFKNATVRYKILKQNVGRFQARLEGAKLASHKQLLFIDDRVELDEDYIKSLLGFKDDLLIGNVIEKRQPGFNPIAASLSAARKKLYGPTFESNFKDYYITRLNFEKSPKGTASLYINKQLFIEICKVVANKKAGEDSRFFNEDTGLMRELIDRGHKILRTSKLKLFYMPRSNFKESVKHLYGRGPRFVDYYINPRSRFFPILIGEYLLIAAALWLVIFGHQLIPVVLLTGVGFLATISIILSKNVSDLIELFVGIPLVFLLFTAGIVSGTVNKLRSQATPKL